MALALAGACAGVFGALLLARPGPAFAEVERAFGDIHTVTWTETQAMGSLDGSGRLRPSVTSEMWVRLDPPAISRRNDGGFRSLIDRRGQLIFEPRRASYTLRRGIAPVVNRQFVFNLISLSGLPPGVSAPKGWTSRREELDGQAVIRFDRDYHGVRTPPRFDPKDAVRITETMWTDAKTFRLVRAERKQYYPGSDKAQFVSTAVGYRYNEEPPAGTWDWDVPKGQFAEVEDDTPTREVWRALPAADRKKLQVLIDRSDRGWVTGDMSLFASSWDFGGLDKFSKVKQNAAERRRQWQIRVTNSHIYKGYGGWKSRIEAGRTVRALPGLGSLPPGTPDLLVLHTATQIRWKDGAKRDALGEYYLARKGDDYRIVRWHLGNPAGVVEDGVHRLPDLP